MGQDGTSQYTSEKSRPVLNFDTFPRTFQKTILVENFIGWYCKYYIIWYQFGTNTKIVNKGVLTSSTKCSFILETEGSLVDI